MAEQASKINEEAMRSEITTCVANVSYDNSDVGDSLINCIFGVDNSCRSLHGNVECIHHILAIIKPFSRELLLTLHEPFPIYEYKKLIDKCSEKAIPGDLTCELVVEVGMLVASSIELHKGRKKILKKQNHEK